MSVGTASSLYKFCDIEYHNYVRATPLMIFARIGGKNGDDVRLGWDSNWRKIDRGPRGRLIDYTTGALRK